MKQYQSDLTDNQWQFIEKMVEDQRKRKYGLRGIVDAIPYISKTGCQWRMLPKDFAPWQSVYYYFGKWKLNGLIEDIHDFLVARLRLKKGKKILPSVGMIDSQSVKSSHLCQGEVGYDGGKKVKGRKRHIVVDTLGLILTVNGSSAFGHTA